MKKLLCLILALVTFFTLSSCELKKDILESDSSAPDSELYFESDNKTDLESDKNDATDSASKGDNKTESDSQSGNASDTEIDNKPSGPSDVELSTPQGSALMVGDANISEYKIVFSSASKSYSEAQAQRLAAHIKDTFGEAISVIEMDINSESRLEKSIIISDILPDGGDTITFNLTTAAIQDIGGVIWISAKNRYALIAAIDKIVSDSIPKTEGAIIKLNYFDNKSETVEATALGEPIKVMSYNVKNGYITAERRKNTVKDVMDFMPDTLGVQEFNQRWVNAFTTEGVFDEYAFVGEQRYGDRDREANDNEYSAILYRKDKFRLIDSGTYWLSDTPDVPDTKLEGSKYVRIMTYAVLERISDGVRFVHVNTHLNTTPSLNLGQVKIMVNLVNERIYARYGELPTYYTGDFNASPLSTEADGYKYLISTGTENARDVAEISSDENTIKGGGMIDHCIVTKGDFLVTFFDVGDEKESEETSNHFPIYIEMYFIPQK